MKRPSLPTVISHPDPYQVPLFDPPGQDFGGVEPNPAEQYEKTPTFSPAQWIVDSRIITAHRMERRSRGTRGDIKARHPDVEDLRLHSIFLSAACGSFEI